MATRDASRLGDLVRRHRTVAALSQEELAERAGLSVRAISDLERGIHQTPRLETVRLVADALRLQETDRADLLAVARPQVMVGAPARIERVLPTALPLLPTRLIGRETEIAAVSALLARDDVRLVTLTGPGGIGKTCLALALASDLRGHYPDGVCFVDLSPLTDPALVLPTIATTLGVREVAGESLRETLIRSLRHRRLLLVLDNCEQVLAAAPDIAALLSACPELIVLATSRVPLHIRAEREITVSPLPLPALDRKPGLPDLAHVPSVTLFVERARATSAEFALTSENAAAVAAICQHLDGLPLAIELAAARIKVLPPAALLARLEQRLPLLTGGSHDLPARQRTMRDAIAWSYDLLSPEEQRLFRLLSVFAGGCTLAAAEAVAGSDGESEVFNGIVALVEQSLMRQVRSAGDEPRYRMLETVREFGLERLAQAGEADDARERHAAHFLRLADSIGQNSGSFWILKVDYLTHFAAERNNAWLALAWFDQRGETDALLRLFAITYGLWFGLGLYGEGLRWIEGALERSHHNTPVARLPLLDGAAMLAIFHGDHAQATTFITEELTLARQFGDPQLIGRALTTAGLLAYRQGSYDQAEGLLQEACQTMRGLVNSVPASVLRLGVALLELGDTALAQEQFERAARWYEEALGHMDPGANYWGPIDAQVGLAGINFCTGNYARAAELYQESLDRARALGISLLVASTLLGLAGIAAITGQSGAGARLLGASEAINGSLDAPNFPRDQPIRDRCLAALQANLGSRQLAIEREIGRMLTVEDAISLARAAMSEGRHSVT